MTEQTIDSVSGRILDLLEDAHARGTRSLVILRCIGPAEVDDARSHLMSARTNFAWRSLPVAELDPPDLVGTALKTAGPEGPTLVAYDLPKAANRRLLDQFIEYWAMAERQYVRGAFRMVLLVTLEEMRDLSSRAKGFWKSRDLYLAWPARAGGYLPATVAGGAPVRRASGVAHRRGDVSKIFGHALLDEHGLATDANMLEKSPWAGAPYQGAEGEIPRYILDANPPAGRRWGASLTDSEDEEGARLIDRCRSLLDQNHTEYARQGLAKACKRFRSMSNGPAMAECYVMLGRASEMRFDHTVAIEWFEQALHVYEGLGDVAGVSDCCAMIGYLRFMHGDLDGAFNFFDRGLRGDEEVEDQLRTAAGFRRVGVVLEEFREFKKARLLYERAADIESENEDRYAYARSLHHMARVSQRLKKLDAAQELLQESIEIKEELGDDPGLATGYHELGSVFLMQDFLEDALDSYERALEIEEQHLDVQGLAVTHAQLGLVHRNLTNFPESAESFALARELLYRLQSPLTAVIERELETAREHVGFSEFAEVQAQARAYVENLLSTT
jgi:tetratricopeptide (TPR) repeat protein